MNSLKIQNSKFKIQNCDAFLLVEALIAILILSVALTASLGGIAGSLQVTKRAEETTKAILAFEPFLYQLEAGERMDLLYYGGKGKIDDYDYEIKSEESGSYHRLKTKFLGGEKDFFDLEIFLPTAIEA